MHCSWIGEEALVERELNRVGEYDETFTFFPRDTYMFFATGKADGTIPAMIKAEVGYYPAGFVPKAWGELFYFLDEGLRSRENIYIHMELIQLPEGNGQGDLWAAYLGAYENEFEGMFHNYGEYPRRADLGTVEIPFYPGSTWESGSITARQQAAIEKMKRIVQKVIEQHDEREYEDAQSPRKYTVYMPTDYAMMNHYIVYDYIVNGAEGAPNPHGIQFFVKYPNGFIQGVTFPSGYSETLEFEKEYRLYFRGEDPRYNIGTYYVEDMLARGAVEEYTVVIE